MQALRCTGELDHGAAGMTWGLWRVGEPRGTRLATQTSSAASGTLTCSQLCTAVHRGFQGGDRQGQQGHQHANMACVLFELRELHAYIPQLDPINVELLSHCLLVMVTLYFPEIFRAADQYKKREWQAKVCWERSLPE
ncbi:hypothetical protein GH733_005702 [Mirounga leonina]|nr:hypothetical protein GH733_005702 [Mirounga leonina]